MKEYLLQELNNTLAQVEVLKQAIEKQMNPEKVTVKTVVEKQITWADIKQAADAGTLKDLLKSGDRIPVTLLNGECIELDVGRDESGKTYFIFHDALKERHEMNPNNTSAGGWSKTSMREYANKIVFNLLPKEIKDIIVPTTIHQVWDGVNNITQDKLFCLSYTQVFGGDLEKEQEPEDTQIDIFKDERSRVKQIEGETSWWWLRSANGGNNFYNVNSSGYGSIISAYGSGAVVLGFCVETA